MAHNATPNGSGGGIWQSGAGLAADASGNIYYISANGTFNASSGGNNFGDSFVKLSPTGSVVDYFTPHNQAGLEAANFDLGSSGLTLLPDQPGLHPRLALSAGKNETIHVVDRDNMGHLQSRQRQPDRPVAGQYLPQRDAGTRQLQCARVFQRDRVLRTGERHVDGVPAEQRIAAGGTDLEDVGGLHVSWWCHCGVRQWEPATEFFGRCSGTAPSPRADFAPTTPAISPCSSTTAIRRARAIRWTSRRNSAFRSIANGKVYVGSMTQLTVFGLLP